MNEQYKRLQRTADRLQFKCQDLLDDRSDPLGQLLIRETREVREDIEASKPPRSVEGRIVSLQRELAKARSTQLPAISPNDADYLFDEYDRLRTELRSLPNY